MATGSMRTGAGRVVSGIGLILAAFSFGCMAAEVAVVGLFPGKAVLVIDAGAPRTLAVGQRLGEVRLVAVERDSAEIEIGGERSKVRLGDRPVSVTQPGAAANEGRQVTLVADARGHFLTGGSINGAAVTFLVDTGASAIAMGPATAVRAGIDYLKGQPAMASTANGVVPTWRVRLTKVNVGDLTVYDVDAFVVKIEMPQVLLGMSFLNRMEMRRDGAIMVLRQRY